jgi:RHS repeat-associated protein
LTDSTGAVTDTYTYDAFGNLLERTGTTSNLYLYAGEQFDPDLGLYYNRARYLDVRNGRFWGMDEWDNDINDPRTLHRYSYAENDPLNGTDPTGHFFLGSKLAFGQIVHDRIGSDLTFRYGLFAFYDRSINEILGTRVFGGALRPDLVNTAAQEVYEIKPALSGSLGFYQLGGYLAVLNRQDPFKRIWIPGFSYIPPTAVDIKPGTVALVSPPAGGVIIYHVLESRGNNPGRSICNLPDIGESTFAIVCIHLMTMPNTTRIQSDAFLVHLYTWCLAQARQEVQQGYRRLAQISNREAALLLNYLEQLNGSDQLTLVLALTKRFHPQAMLLMGDKMDRNETRLGELYIAWRRVVNEKGGQLPPDLASVLKTFDFPQSADTNLLTVEITRQLESICGPVDPDWDRGTNWRHKYSVKNCHLLTYVDVSRGHTVRYSHQVSFLPGIHFSFLTAVGLSADTSWKICDSFQLIELFSSLAECVRSFVDCFPNMVLAE